jgi:hypothetical protein
MLLSCQSITSYTSISFLFVLNYKFLLVFRFPFVFVIPFILFPFPLTTISDPLPFLMIKCGYGNGKGFSVLAICRQIAILYAGKLLYQIGFLLCSSSMCKLRFLLSVTLTRKQGILLFR